jgi:hypothetical protein
MNLGCPKVANLALRGLYLILVFTIFVHEHMLREEPDHSLSMLYGCKVIRLPNSGLPILL